jgi:hypothetical protein
MEDEDNVSFDEQPDPLEESAEHLDSVPAESE